MTPIRNWVHVLSNYVPLVLVLVLYIFLWPIRVLVNMLLPVGAEEPNHRLYSVYNFWRFG